MSARKCGVSGVNSRKQIQLNAVAETEERLKELASPTRRRTAKSIHQARVSIKRLCSQWQLIRPAVGKERTKAAIGELKQTARHLARARDAHVLSKTLERLRKRREAPSDREVLEAIRHALEAEFGATGSATQAPVDWRAVREGLEAERDRWRRWRPKSGPKGLIEAGLRRLFHKAHRTGRKALRSERPEDFHAWRKWVKYLLYQVEAIGALRPERSVDVKLIGRLDRLGDVLGKHHDLFVLAAAVERIPAIHGDPVRFGSFRAIVTREADRMRGRAAELSKRIFGSSAKRFVENVMAARNSR